ncbi:Uncharacterised protein [Salmonella enterica subsp. salamae]|uniref:Uncharacterized protein n=1 Tax=Salmonella enterica subsp. salamae TaxID=59202 RepID=A0A6D2G4M1_SALER|nr:Uncharacterised protein [Salmonella enterica subsp. salamae]
MNLGRVRRFVNGVDAGKVTQLARARFFIQPFRIALFTDSQRRIDINLDKTLVADALLYQLPLGAGAEK